MRAGQHDRRISIEYKSVELDPQFGTEVITWVRLAVMWAEVQDVLPSRSEALKMGLAVARNQTRIRLRWRNDITSDMRVVVHGDTDTVYQIVGGPAAIGGRKERIEIMCEKYSS